MTGRIDVIAPATLTVVNGGSLISSLQALPPYGITVTDPEAGDTLSLTLIAANAKAVRSTAAAGGADVVAQGNTLSLTGTAAQVNAALAGLQLMEPANAIADRLTLTASDPAVLAAVTDIAVQLPPAGTAAFASPPANLTVQPNALSPLAGLLLDDPQALGLAAAGQGRRQTLSISLTVGAGILLLPGLLPTTGIIASGLGTGSVSLIFTADRLSAVNTILAGLTYAGPGQTWLNYSMTNLIGPLGPAAISGAVSLQAAGSTGVDGTFSAGAQTVILGNASSTAGFEVTGVEAVTGNLDGSVFIGGAGDLDLPAGLLSLSGTSIDFGTAAAATFDVAGAAILAKGASVAGEISVGATSLIDFGGTLIGSGGAQRLDQPAVTLAAHAILAGDGTLVAGNESDPGMITGPGTLLAAAGNTLSIEAGSIAGGANLLVAGGGVLELAGQALFGIDSSVTLGFAPGYGVAPIIGGFADSLSEDGGVIVIDDPLAFDAGISGFSPGDRLVFPGLTGLTLSSISSQSFLVTGLNSASQPVQFTLRAAIQAGTTLETGLDAQGDGQIGLRDSGVDMFVGARRFSATQIDASVGVGQTLPGLQLLLQGWTSQSLVLTLSVGQGVLSEAGQSPAAQLTLTAASPAALNALLAKIVYTADLSASGDTLTASSDIGLLAGLNSQVPIVIEPGGTISGFAQTPSEAQTVLFAASQASSPLVTQAAASGEIIVSGTVDFADMLAAGGVGGTALSIDAGGIAIFDAGSAVTLGGDALVGDATGAGTIGVVTTDFTIGAAGAPADLVVGGNSAAAGSAAEVTGALTVSGNVRLGQEAEARLDVSGNVNAAGTTIGGAGTLIASGYAALSLGELVDAGTLVLENAAQAAAQQLLLAGQLTLGGGTTLSGIASAVIGNGGSLLLMPDAAFNVDALNAIGGSILDAGTASVAGNLLAGDAITLAGGIMQAGIVTLASNATLTGFGDLVATGAGSKIALAGEILASGGVLALDGNLTMSGGGSIAVAGSAGLDLIHGASGGVIGFTGADAVLTINDLAVESSGVSGMQAGDVIDLVGVAPSLVSYAGGTISATDGGGNPLGGFALEFATLQPAVRLLSDGEGGALITSGGELACFLRGTRILTPNGYLPVEHFKPGDPVITRFGVRRAVRWIGRRDVTTGLSACQDMRPVLIVPNAIAPGQPSRPVRLSPSHAVFIDGALVPVMHLVNGATILREPRRGVVSYFHLELDRHEIMLAEGLPVESYLDVGHRHEFRHQLGVPGNACKTCAPLLIAGPKLTRIRRRLHAVTLQAGFTLTRDPSLQLRSGEVRVTPEIRQHRGGLTARFQLPPATDHLVLQANSAAPAETDPDSDDRRVLALCLRPLCVRRQLLRLGPGWHEKTPGDAGIWMSGEAEISLPAPGRELTLHFAAIAPSWRLPAVDLGEARD